ncbi:MAG: flagellar hook capping FlgD N-terminal domain-containing protein, partial [Hyphomonas sp.]|nr:flagellar hook capping FlgD N-terminal domain-containing protein [Hyphomonas sp.]
STVESTASQAFGLGFEDLLRIVLTQLTYQDPLKPIENFEFVSQLAQFSQIQQTQTMSDRLLGMLQAEATTQATTLLGRRVEIPSGPVTISGKVTSVSFLNGEPRLTLQTDDARSISNIALSSVNRISQGE